MNETPSERDGTRALELQTKLRRMEYAVNSIGFLREAAAAFAQARAQERANFETTLGEMRQEIDYLRDLNR